MELSSIHTASGLLMICFFLAKIGIQILLDVQHARWGGVASEVMFFTKYFKPYRAEVAQGFGHLKYLCNVLFRLSAMTLTINVSVGMLMLLQ